MPLNKKKRFSVFAGIAAGLSIWQVSALIIDRELILPRLDVIGASMVHIVTAPAFFYTVYATLLRIMLTIGCDTAAAFLFGLIAGLSQKCEAAFSPFETAIRSMPTMGVLLLSLIWFQSEVTPLFVSSLIVFPILYRGVVNGVKNIDFGLKEMSYGFRVPFFRKVLRLYLPASIPFIRTAYAAALGLLVKVMVTAEVLSQPRYGIGTEFQIARSQLDTASIFAWSILVIILAAVLEYGSRPLFFAVKSLIHFLYRVFTVVMRDEKIDYMGAAVPIPLVAENSALKAAMASAPVSVRIQNLSFAFDSVPLFQNYNLNIEAEKITCLQGPSGKGKTSLLFLIAGFLQPQKGAIIIDPQQALMSFAYQDIRLIPHLTAEENICYVLPKPYRPFAKSLAYYYLALLGLQGFEHFLPSELSGGMQRRVGLARALAYPAKLILLDEAFDSLDKKTRDSVVQTCLTILHKRKATVFCVSHDAAITSLLADNNAIIL